MPHGLIQEAFVRQSDLILWSKALSTKYKHDHCAICHEAFNPALPDICRVLDCGHIFHAKCVDLWFIKATFCPLCKSDLKLTYRNSSSQRSLERSSQTSSHRSLGSRSPSSSLRSGQILVGHSNSDPALLGILRENPGVFHRSSPPTTPDRLWQHHSTTSLAISHSDRSLPASRSEHSIGILSSSSSGALPAVQEVSDEARAAEDSLRSQDCDSPVPEGAAQEVVLCEDAVESEEAPMDSANQASGASAPVMALAEHSDVGTPLPSVTEDEHQAAAVPVPSDARCVSPSLVRIVSLTRRGAEAPAGGAQHRITVAVARGRTGHTVPCVLPPAGERQESSPASGRSSARSASVPPAAAQGGACGEQKQGAGASGLGAVSSSSSSTPSVASATPALCEPCLPPVVAMGTKVVATRVAIRGYPMAPAVRAATTPYIGTVAQRSSVVSSVSRPAAYGATRPVAAQEAARARRSSAPITQSRSNASLGVEGSAPQEVEAGSVGR